MTINKTSSPAAVGIYFVHAMAAFHQVILHPRHWLSVLFTVEQVVQGSGNTEELNNLR